MTPIRFQLEDPVIGLAWSPDGRRLAVAGISGPCSIIEAATASAVQSLAGHNGGTLAISWSAQGEVIATGGQDGKVRLWSADTGVCQRELDGGAAWVEQVAFSPDGTMLAATAGKKMRLWNTNGEMLYEFAGHESTVSALQWRADGKGVATACYGKIRCFRTGEAKPYETLNWKSSFISLAWSPNGRILCAGTQENTIQFYRLPSRGEEPLRMSGYPAKVKQLAWDRGARFLACGGGDGLTVWDVSGKGPAGRIPLQLDSHPANISALAYQRHGDVLTSGCEFGALILWNPAQSDWPVNEPTPTDKFLHAVRLPGAINQLCWSPDESMLAAGCQDGTVAFLQSPNSQS
jgi:WD40 repeat protein